MNEIPFGLQKTPGGRDEERIYLYCGDSMDEIIHQNYYRSDEMQHNHFARLRESALQQQRFQEDLTPSQRMNSEIRRKTALLEKLCTALLNDNGQPALIDRQDFQSALIRLTRGTLVGIAATKAEILSILNNDPRFQRFLRFDLSFLQPRQRPASLSMTTQPGLTFFRPQAAQERPQEKTHVAATPTRHYPSPMEGID